MLFENAHGIVPHPINPPPTCLGTSYVLDLTNNKRSKTNFYAN